jgi:AcrR family transcriptional regulator
VRRVMANTTLARETFYLYFRDRHDLLLRLLSGLREEIDGHAEGWRAGAPDRYAAGRAALRGLIELYVEHGVVLRALAAAAAEDEQARHAWSAFTEQGEKRTAARLREDMRRGLISEIDPDETAKALCAMNREYLFQTVVGRPGVDLGAVLDTLHTIWWRSLYAAGGTG